MKKSIFALLLALVLMFAGCSCNNPVTLSFSDWESASGYKETTTYAVNFKSDYVDGDLHNFKQIETLSQYFTPSFEQGTYTSVIEIIEQSSVPSYVVSDVLDTQAETRPSIIKQTTSFSITGKYTPVNGDEVAFTDNAETESYFRLTDTSLAPIYSHKSSIYTMAKIKENEGKKGVETFTEKVVSTTLYNKSEYVIKTFDYDEYMNASDKTAVEPKETSSIGYTYRTAIDNASLLLAIRNLALQKDASTNLPTISPAYKNAQTLKVSSYNTKNQIVKSELTVNGTDIDDNLEVPVNCLSFAINAQNSGKAQLVYVQNADAKNSAETVVIPNKRLMIKYVTP